MRLHLGCGKLKLRNFINVDIDSPVADIKLNITDLSIINTHCVDEIYICHVLEHFKRYEIIDLFLAWNRVLKSDGILRISVPDFEKIVSVYTRDKKLYELIGFLNGGQKNMYDIHYVNFDYATLTALLSACGFSNFNIYDPHEFLGDQDDYSKAYLPHMDSANGELMSLNIVCNKTRDVSKADIQLSDDLKRYVKYV
jgi:predicted SAM-dependent methyltransferase